MPFYEYECKACKHQFEEFQGISDEPLKICPECGGEVRQLISMSSAQVEFGNAREYYEKVIRPDAKRIADKIKGGDEDAAADIFGSGGE